MKALLFILSVSFSVSSNSTYAQDKAEVQLSHLKINTEAMQINASSKAKYQYYPNLRAYFNTETSEYLYQVEKVWITNKEIPTSYRGYSIYNNYRVELIGYNADKPYENISEHIKSYPYYSNDRKGKLAALKAKRISDEKLLAVYQ
jgi:hypothetical protein